MELLRRKVRGLIRWARYEPEKGIIEKTRLATRLERRHQVPGSKKKESIRASLGLGVPSPKPRISATLGEVRSAAWPHLRGPFCPSPFGYPGAFRKRIWRIAAGAPINDDRRSRFQVAPQVHYPE